MTVGGGPNAGAGQNGYAGKIIIYKRAAEECGLGSYGDPSVTCTQCPAVRGNTLQVCLQPIPRQFLTAGLRLRALTASPTRSKSSLK